MPSLFGQNQTNVSPAGGTGIGGGGLFGNATAASFNFSTSQATAGPGASGPSLFNATTLSNFGGGQAQTQSQMLFGGGGGGGQLQTGGQGTGMVAQPPDDSALRELQSIQESYVAAQGNSRHKFQYLFLNVVKDPAARVKPSDVDELQWRDALRRAGGPDNPYCLWPVPYNGFKGLLDRKKFQTEAMNEHKERLSDLQKRITALANRHETVLRVQMERIKESNNELSQKLLLTLRHIDALEGRFSRAIGYDTNTSLELLQKLDQELKGMESTIAINSAHGLLGRVDAMASAARVQSHSRPGSDTKVAVSDESLTAAFNILKDFAEAISKMQDTLHRNARDISVLSEIQTRLSKT